MRQIISIFLTVLVMASACNSSKNIIDIQPKSGNLEIPAAGELRVWNNIAHTGFEVRLTNTSPAQSCELYYVQSNGNEKWVNPSLLANSSQTVKIPAKGHLFVKNFNPNTLTISYAIEE